MSWQYETEPLSVIKAAFSQLCEEALYLETESECGPINPCPEYCAMLRSTLSQIKSAKTFDDIARIEWVSGKAAMAL